uniref:Phosphoribosylformylglycinamidine synthase 2 n=1 Tax=Lygus hesperus TaxID=30085 RepID=A0A0A9XME2_LYGHE
MLNIPRLNFNKLRSNERLPTPRNSNIRSGRHSSTLAINSSAMPSVVSEISKHNSLSTRCSKEVMNNNVDSNVSGRYVCSGKSGSNTASTDITRHQRLMQGVRMDNCVTMKADTLSSTRKTAQRQQNNTARN